jgi:hypothetical protein
LKAIGIPGLFAWSWRRACLELGPRMYGVLARDGISMSNIFRAEPFS